MNSRPLFSFTADKIFSNLNDKSNMIEEVNLEFNYALDYMYENNTTQAEIKLKHVVVNHSEVRDIVSIITETSKLIYEYNSLNPNYKIKLDTRKIDNEITYWLILERIN